MGSTLVDDSTSPHCRFMRHHVDFFEFATKNSNVALKKTVLWSVERTTIGMMPITV